MCVCVCVCVCRVVVQWLSCVPLFETQWTAARLVPLSFTIFQSLLKFMSTESVMLSDHLILCHPFLLLPSIFPSIRIFCNESAYKFIYIYLSLLSGSSFPLPWCPSPLGITECQTGLPVLYCSFPLAVCFTHGSVYVWMQPSQFVPPSSSPAMSISLFWTPVSLFLPCK